MSARALVFLAAFFLEDNDLFVTFVFENGNVHAGTVHVGAAEFGVCALADTKHLADGECVAILSVLVTVDFEDVALTYGELASLGFNNRFHDEVFK